MAKLTQKTLKLAREEHLKSQYCNDIEETIAETSMKDEDNRENVALIRIQDLCLEDRIKIRQLISHLAKYTNEKYRLTADLAVSKAETTKLQYQLQLFDGQHEDIKNKLRSELSSIKTELKKTKLQTLRSLKLLTQQIMALENQSKKLLDTAKLLLLDKVSLYDTLVQKTRTVWNAQAEVRKIKNSQSIDSSL